MSLNGQDLQATIVATFPMPTGTRFEWHTHSDHQLAWSPEGVLIVLTDAGTYILPPTRALWIPADTPHETRASGAAILQSAYLRPARCPITWTDPSPVVVTPLLAELISHLGSDDLASPQRSRAETLLFDLLTPLHTPPLDVDLPADPRAREVADALLGNPADGRTLQAWGRQVGASSRTLARAFLAETGLSFGRWRTLIRLQAALPQLAEGAPVSLVADQVGYRTASAFVSALRAQAGAAPGRYFRSQSR